MSYMSWVLCFEYVVTNCVSYPLSFSVLFLCLKIKDIKYFNLNTRVQSLFFLYIWALQHLFVKKYENTKCHQFLSNPKHTKDNTTTTQRFHDNDVSRVLSLPSEHTAPARGFRCSFGGIGNPSVNGQTVEI